MSFPQKTKGTTMIALKTNTAIVVLITSGRVSPFLAAISAANGNIVNVSVAAKKFAISENRVAM